MFCINLETTDPFFNLAVDEYLLKNRKEDFLVLGINETSVIIGKHQVVHRETDTKFITLHNIPVIRRISGGGTVFHDRGNLNFSFILNSKHGYQVDFRKYTQPVIDFLSSLGIKAEFEGRSDLKVGGFKISGNSEHVYHDRVLHHGTLLFDSDLDHLANAIRKDKGRYSTRAVESNPVPVINLNYVLKDVLKDVLKYVDKISDFRSLMLGWFLNNLPGSEVIEISETETNEIKQLVEKKYRTWEWNYGYGPEYHFENRFACGGNEMGWKLFVKDGIIWECEVEGSGDLRTPVKNLIGCRHMPEDVQEALGRKNIAMWEFDVFELF